MHDFSAINDNITRSQIIIITPFSHIYEKGNKYQVGKDASVEARKKLLFTDERLELRFSYFENICLSSLDAQTDQNFILLVRCSDQLPEKWVGKLHQLASTRKYMYVSFLSVDENPRTYEKNLIIDKLLPKDQSVVITARLDDDDALASSYISSLRKYADTKFLGFGVSFGKGYYLTSFESGGERAFSVVEQRLRNPAVGLAYISNIKDFKHYIFQPPVAGHLNLDTAAPVVVDCTRPMFIVTAHDHNDSNRLQKKNMTEFRKISTKEAFSVLEDGFSSVKIDRIPSIASM